MTRAQTTRPGPLKSLAVRLRRFLLEGLRHDFDKELRAQDKRHKVALGEALDRQARELTKAFEGQQARQLGELQQRVRDLELSLNKVPGPLSKMKDRIRALEAQEVLGRVERKKALQKLNALLRREYVAELVANRYPHAITARRFGLLSQNEEDGMTLALLKACGVRTKTFVEIGSGMNGGNSGVLAEELGWRGLMVDLQPHRVERCVERFGEPGRVECRAYEVTSDNIDRILEDHGLTGEVDFFSLDIDSYDYWVLEAMTACSPRVLVVEYNADFGPEAAVTIPHDASLEGVPQGYHGASLAAFGKLCARKGYRLVGCDASGTNAYFLRNDLQPEIPAVSVERAYRPPRDRRRPEGDDLREPNDIAALARERGLPLVAV
jgi:hypothetical protein